MELEQEIKVYIAKLEAYGLGKDHPDITSLRLAGDIVHCYAL